MGANTAESWDWESRYVKASAEIPSSEEILAEIDPFLEVIGCRTWSLGARHLALVQMGHTPEVNWRFHPRWTSSSDTW